jgi:hypothetical protein
MGKRDGPGCSTAVWTVGVGMASGGAGGGGSAHSWWRRVDEQGRVAGAADRWGRDESKAQFQWWGAGGRWVSEAAQRRGGNRRFKLSFKPIQKYSNGSNEF